VVEDVAVAVVVVAEDVDVEHPAVAETE